MTVMSFQSVWCGRTSKASVTAEIKGCARSARAATQSAFLWYVEYCLKLQWLDRWTSWRTACLFYCINITVSLLLLCCQWFDSIGWAWKQSCFNNNNRGLLLADQPKAVLHSHSHYYEFWTSTRCTRLSCFCTGPVCRQPVRTGTAKLRVSYTSTFHATVKAFTCTLLTDWLVPYFCWNSAWQSHKRGKQIRNTVHSDTMCECNIQHCQDLW